MKMPFYVVTASVAPGNRVVNFHGADSGSASALIASIPPFRHGSFDLAVPAWPEPGPDDSLELRLDERKMLRLYQDGTLVFRARADHEFLGWGVEPNYFPRFPKLNPLVVVEVNTSFVHWYRAIVQQLKHPTDQVFFHLSLHDFTQEGIRLFLTKYFSKGRVDWGTVTKYSVQTDPAEEEFRVPISELLEAPNRVAYEVVRTFVSMFDMPETEIPFVVRDEDRPEIDLERIKAL